MIIMFNNIMHGMLEYYDYCILIILDTVCSTIMCSILSLVEQEYKLYSPLTVHVEVLGIKDYFPSLV